MSRNLMMRAAGANYAEVQRLQAEIDRLRADLAEARMFRSDECDRLRAENAELDDRCGKLEAELYAYRQKFHPLMANPAMAKAAKEGTNP